MSDLYNLLGVNSQASGDEIRRAFRREAKHWHPDALAGRPAAEREAGRQRFILLAQAYQLLSDPQRRRAYDQGQAAGATPSGSSGAAEGMPRSGARHSPRTAAGASRTRQRASPEREAGRGGGTLHNGQRGPAGAGSGTSRVSAREAGATARSAAQRGPSAFRAQQAYPAQDLGDLLKEAEQSLARFGLDRRNPVDAALDELLAWASALYRDLAGAVTGSAPAARTGAGAGAAGVKPAAGRRAEAQAWGMPRPEAGPSAQRRARPSAAFRHRAGGEMARFDRLSVERELEQIKRSVRNAPERPVPAADEALEELRRSHGKKP